MKLILLTFALSFLVCSQTLAQTKDSTNSEDYYDHSPDDSVAASGEYMPAREALYNTARMPIIKEKVEIIEKVSFPQKNNLNKVKNTTTFKTMQSKTAYSNSIQRENLVAKKQKL